MTDRQKPPIGPVPRHIWIEHRVSHLAETIANASIPTESGDFPGPSPEWIEELLEHTHWLSNRRVQQAGQSNGEGCPADGKAGFHVGQKVFVKFTPNLGPCEVTEYLSTKCIYIIKSGNGVEMTARPETLEPAKD